MRARYFQGSCMELGSTKPHLSNFIVKEGKIARLKQSRKSVAPVATKEQPCFVESTSQYIKTKQNYLRRSPSTQSDFYDIEKQLVINRHSLYRKMNVALRHNNMGVSPQPQNPFKRRRMMSRDSRGRFDKDKNLTELIYQVQPYWIKKHINKTLPNLE